MKKLISLSAITAAIFGVTSFEKDDSLIEEASKAAYSNDTVAVQNKPINIALEKNFGLGLLRQANRDLTGLETNLITRIDFKDKYGVSPKQFEIIYIKPLIYINSNEFKSNFLTDAQTESKLVKNMIKNARLHHIAKDIIYELEDVNGNIIATFQLKEEFKEKVGITVEQYQEKQNKHSGNTKTTKPLQQAIPTIQNTTARSRMQRKLSMS